MRETSRDNLTLWTNSVGGLFCVFLEFIQYCGWVSKSTAQPSLNDSAMLAEEKRLIA